MKRILNRLLSLTLLGSMAVVFVSCANLDSNQSENDINKTGTENSTSSGKTELNESKKSNITSDKNVLIAYFSLAENYEDVEGVDATSQASVNVKNGEIVGNTKYLAEDIQEIVGGDLFSVIVEEPYPNNYDTVVDMGVEEQDANARPALASHVENMEQYDVVFLGYPIWWYTMPQAMFTFLEEYDFTGKTIIPFATHGGFGAKESIDDIKSLCPDATVLELFEAERDDVSDRQEDIGEWIKSLGLQ